MSSYRYHQRGFIPARARAAYAELVNAWLQEALPLCTPENVKQQSGRWVARINQIPGFEFADGVHSSIRPISPADLLLRHRTHDKAQQELKRIARELMREASPADEREFRKQYPARAAK